ncbi:MAG: tRNA lysidine(34) synthetase TilS [Campylobacteraceae bacterium]|nr:tRNA lysidine(34) synthetase TilS [Campylobacteraceae bacterium]
MINLKINTSRNLLAFSAGIDSTALFFILLENNIEFDIAIVNYNLREQSKKEVQYAKDLAKKYNKKCFIKDVKSNNISNFEKEARDIRYKFFNELINEYNYKRLFTAHQLNDKLEWFLMQLSKGAGLLEILGLNEEENKHNYILSRPLLECSKKSLEEYLIKNDIKYFIDESNLLPLYTRNKFRLDFANDFMNKYEKGVRSSFKYLKDDLKSLNIKEEAIFQIKELEIFENLDDDNLNIRIIDKSLKRRGFLISQKQREEIIKQKEIVVSHKISISIYEKYIFISPKASITMSKKFKDECRKINIPKNIREYLFKKNIDLKDLRV